MKNVFLVLAIIGAIVPYVFFLEHFAAHGIGLNDFVDGVFATPAATGFTADLLITSLAFWIYMFRARGNGGPQPLPFVVVNLLIGLSCALPAYLYVVLRAESHAESSAESRASTAN